MEDAPSLLNARIIPATGSGCCAGDGWRRGGTCSGWQAAQLALLSATARCHPLKRVFSHPSSAGISRLLPGSRLQPVGSPRLSLLRHEHERAGESWSSQMSPLKNPAKRVEIPRPGLKQGGQAFTGMSFGLILIRRGQEEPEPTWPSLLLASDDPG